MLPVDLEPARYLKIGEIILALGIGISKLSSFLVEHYPQMSIINGKSGLIISQCESISILLTFIWMILLTGIMVYNHFSKVEKRNKFFKGVNRHFSSARSVSRRVHRNNQEEEETGILNSSRTINMSREDAFGSMEQMGIFGQDSSFINMINNMVYE